MTPGKRSLLHHTHSTTTAEKAYNADWNVSKSYSHIVNIHICTVYDCKQAFLYVQLTVCEYMVYVCIYLCLLALCSCMCMPEGVTKCVCMCVSECKEGDDPVGGGVASW